MSEKKPSLPQRSLGQSSAPPPAVAPPSGDDEFEVTLDDDAPPPDIANLADPWGDGGKEVIASKGVVLDTVAPLVAQMPPPAPLPVGHQSSFDMLMEGARELFALHDLSGALETAEKALEIEPQNKDAVDLVQKCREMLMKMFESRITGMHKRPRVKVDPSEVMWLSLDHRAGFVLAQIDGFVTYEELLQLSGMSRFDTLRILAKLCEEGVIESL